MFYIDKTLTKRSKKVKLLTELLTELKKYDSKEICFKSGVSFSTLNNLLSGRNTNPTIDVVEKLQNFLEEKENELSSQR